MATTAIPSPTFPRQLIRHPPLPSLIVNHKSSSRLCAFGGGGFGSFNVNPPIKTKKDILQRIQLIAMGTAKQFASGFTNGYVLGLVWDLFRGPSLTVANRSVAWGLDFGVLSALFSCTNSVGELVLALATKRDEKDSDGDGKSLGLRQKVTLWSVVIRNMILAIYFGRSGGLVAIARSSVLYGGLTYFFVGKKIKRDGDRMNVFGGNATGMMGGGQPSPEAMQQLLVQLMSTKGPMPPSATMGTPPSSPKQASQGFAQSSSAKPTSSSSSPLFNEKEKSIKDAVDVEFEKTVTDEDD